MRATEFLSEELQGLTVEAQPTPTGGWVVSAYLDENEIGWTRFHKTGSGKFKASMAFVSEKMRRQGVARAIYAYARQQLGLDIIPSDSQSSDATAFWKSGAATVDEQVQPELTNGEGFEHTVDRNGITLKAASNGHGALQIKAFVQGKKAGEAYFEMTPDNQHIASDDTHVDERFRRTGIATVMYQYAKELGNSIAPSPDRTPDGNAMWLGFMRKNSMVENFADGRNPEDKGDSARHGIAKGSTISQLKKIRSSPTASARKKQLAHWQINMRQGKKK